MRQALVLALVLAALAAPAAAQAPGGDNAGGRVDLTVTRYPAEVLAGALYPLNLTLQSHLNGAVETTLFAGLFVPGGSPRCDAAGPGFRGYVEVARVTIPVPARATVTYPPEGGSQADRFNLRVPPERGVAPGDYEVCVWAVDTKSPTQVPDVFDVFPFPMRVRVTNEVPEVDFRWSPAEGTTDTLYTFEALAGPDVEGDPLTFSWDFGHLTVSGVARAVGQNVTHAFYPAKTYRVTLTVSDGFGTATRTHEVTVGRAATSDTLTPAPAEPESPLPFPGAGLLLVAALAVAAVMPLRRRRA